ncbi:MAG: winged helix family two component transcriptional regulator [Chloroflexi bacterium]|nr:MAG: winged helix family two component transcriptional regulator [Chloroflexota bacterium]MBA4376404.1 hypothetical protein [Anaerolinea sp.]
MDGTNILLVEDDDNVALTIERCLNREKFNVELASSGVQALKLARKKKPDLVLLDVVMPGMDGYEVCREMRADSALMDVPIIFLTAKTREEDHIKGFKAGGDDYINKPFNIEELVLRVRAVLRRTSERHPVHDKKHDEQNINNLSHSADKRDGNPVIEIRNYSLNIKTFELTMPDKKKLLLTPIQYDLLYNFMSHPGEIYSPARLLGVIWDYPSDAGSPDLVRVHIKNLRMRIETDPTCPTFIETIPGYGYTVRGESHMEKND